MICQDCEQETADWLLSEIEIRGEGRIKRVCPCCLKENVDAAVEVSIPVTVYKSLTASEAMLEHATYMLSANDYPTLGKAMREAMDAYTSRLWATTIYPEQTIAAHRAAARRMAS